MLEKICTSEELYRREKDLKKKDILALQEWVNRQSHLPAIDEFFLICFLHACHYKVESTKVCLENFYTLRAHWPEFSQHRDIFTKENQMALRGLLVAYLPVRTKEDYVVFYTRLIDTNIDHFDMLGQIRILDMIVWMWYMYIGTNPGQVMVIDMEGATLGHIMKLNLVHLRKHVHYVQEALPVRLKAIHLISVSSLTDKLLTVIKPFMKKDLVDLIHTHPKIDTLYEYVPKEGLPKEYGGEAGTFEELHSNQIRMAEEHAQVFLDSEEMIADESKRQGKAKDSIEAFGVKGSFRKLDID